jgi:hypothetical protein
LCLRSMKMFPCLLLRHAEIRASDQVHFPSSSKQYPTAMRQSGDSIPSCFKTTL